MGRTEQDDSDSAMTLSTAHNLRLMDCLLLGLPFNIFRSQLDSGTETMESKTEVRVDACAVLKGFNLKNNV